MNDPVPASTVFRWALAASAAVAAVAIVLAAVWAVRGILVLILIALFIAISLDPAVRWLVHHGIRRPWAVTIILILAMLLVSAVIYAVAPPLLRQAGQISTDMPRYIDSLDERSRAFRELSNRYGLAGHLNRIAETLPERIGTSALGFFQKFLSAVATMLLIVALTVYFMADLPRIRHNLPRLLPAAHRDRAHQVINVVVDKVGIYMIGNLATSAIAGIVAYAGLTVLRVPFAVPLALWVAVVDLIPLIGAALGAIVCVLVAAITGGIWPTAVLTLAFLIAYQQLENYVIVPRVMRSSLDMSAVAVLLAGLLGAALLGLVGALMAIPIAAAIKAVLAEFTAPDAPHSTSP